jgi:hypothetical protein
LCTFTFNAILGHPVTQRACVDPEISSNLRDRLTRLLDDPDRTLTELSRSYFFRFSGIPTPIVDASTVSGEPQIWFYVLEAAGLRVQLVNARDVKNVPGRPKTDKLDSVWLAKLTEKGMLRPSFVPPAEVRAPKRPRIQKPDPLPTALTATLRQPRPTDQCTLNPEEPV